MARKGGGENIPEGGEVGLKHEAHAEVLLLGGPFVDAPHPGPARQRPVRLAAAQGPLQRAPLGLPQLDAPCARPPPAAVVRPPPPEEATTLGPGP